VDCINPGDYVLIQGRVEVVDDVNYETKTVTVYPYRYGFNAVQRLPGWATTWYNYLLEEAKKPEFDFVVPVVKVDLKPHPHADELSVMEVYGKTVVVRTDEFVGVETAMYIPTDSRILSGDAYWNWLGRDKRRIRCRKYRGVASHGLLVPVEGFTVGKDVQAFKEICFYKSTEPRNSK
jgi:hypothetical protein